MAGKAACPTGAEVNDLFAGAGITLNTTLTTILDTLAEAGRLRFERDTGRSPFLAGAATQRRFDPPTRSRELHLTPTLATLSTVLYQPTGGTAVTLTEGTDFTAYPWNYAAQEEPITQLRFSTRRWQEPLSLGQRGSLYITGQWGYATTVPEDAWLAMAAAAALELAPSAGQALRDGLVRWSEKDRSEQYESGLAGLVKGWEMLYGAAVRRYRQITF